MSKLYKAVIIDDETLARQDLKAMLQDFPIVEVIGEASNADEAKSLLATVNPDLIFLDIQMPGKSGFELLEDLKTNAKIIFVTAYDEYAIRAFEINVQDYLLKPVNKERLTIALDHLKQKSTIDEEDLYKKMDYNDNIFLMVNNVYQFIRVNSIIKINSAGNYSEIYTTTKQKGLILKSMREWELRLPGSKFVRVHRNAIINLEYVDHIEDWFNYSYHIYIRGLEKPVVMSRRYATRLKEQMA